MSCENGLLTIADNALEISESSGVVNSNGTSINWSAYDQIKFMHASEPTLFFIL